MRITSNNVSSFKIQEKIKYVNIKRIFKPNFIFFQRCSVSIIYKYIQFGNIDTMTMKAPYKTWRWSFHFRKTYVIK